MGNQASVVSEVSNRYYILDPRVQILENRTARDMSALDNAGARITSIDSDVRANATMISANKSALGPAFERLSLSLTSHAGVYSTMISTLNNVMYPAEAFVTTRLSNLGTRMPALELSLSTLWSQNLDARLTSMESRVSGLATLFDTLDAPMIAATSQNVTALNASLMLPMSNMMTTSAQFWDMRKNMVLSGTTPVIFAGRLDILSNNLSTNRLNILSYQATVVPRLSTVSAKFTASLSAVVIPLNTAATVLSTQVTTMSASLAAKMTEWDATLTDVSSKIPRTQLIALSGTQTLTVAPSHNGAIVVVTSPNTVTFVSTGYPEGMVVTVVNATNVSMDVAKSATAVFRNAYATGISLTTVNVRPQGTAYFTVLPTGNIIVKKRRD